MAQFGRPISDISTGGWSTTPLWSDLDDNSDADFITSSKNPASDTFENALTSTLSDPASSTGHIVRARMYCSKANNGTGTMYLYQGTTLIATYAIPGNIANSWTTYSYTLTGTEADNITDYTALRIRVAASGTANAYVYCSWTELEIPDYAFDGNESVSLSRTAGVSASESIPTSYLSASLSRTAGLSVVESVPTPPGVVFDIDVEEGDLTDWDTTSGTITATTGSALVGTYGMAVDTTSGSGAYGQISGISSDLSGKTNWRYRMYLDPNSFTMADGDNFWLVWGRDSGPTNLRFELRFNKSGSNYQTRAAVKNDAEGTEATLYYNLSDASQYVEVRCQKATNATSSDGELQLYIDGVSQELIDTIDNYDTFEELDHFRIGAATSLDVGTSGTFYMDDIIFRNDDTPIGPDGPGTIEEAATLAIFKGISEASQLNLEGAVSLARSATQTASGGLSVEDNTTLAKLKGVTEDSYASAPESVNLTRDAGQTASNFASVQEVTSLSKFNAIVPSTLVNAENYTSLDRTLGVTFDGFGIFDHSVSLSRGHALAVLEDFTTTIEEAVNIARWLGVSPTTLINSGELVNLAKVAAVSSSSQVVAYSAATLNRINTIPTGTLGSLYELINLSHLGGLSVLEETQGQINENVTLNRVLAILGETLIEGNEDVGLAEVLGLIADSQEDSTQSIGLGIDHGLAVLEETQGQINETVLLSRVMSLVSSSQVETRGDLALSQLYTLGAESKHVAMTSVVLGSTYGLSNTVFPQLSELVPLNRVHTISLADNVSTVEGVNLLMSLFATVSDKKYDLDNISDRRVYYVIHRDKRYRITLRDKRDTVIFRDRRG